MAKLMGAQGTGPAEISKVRMVSYLTHRLEVRFPKMGANVRAELRTTCEALDNMFIGEVGRAADLFMQRTKAIETSLKHGNWKLAAHQEVTRAEGGVTSMEESLAAAKVELQHTRLQEQLRKGGGGNR